MLLVIGYFLVMGHVRCMITFMSKDVSIVRNMVILVINVISQLPVAIVQVLMKPEVVSLNKTQLRQISVVLIVTTPVIPTKKIIVSIQLIQSTVQSSRPNKQNSNAPFLFIKGSSW